MPRSRGRRHIPTKITASIRKPIKIANDRSTPVARLRATILGVATLIGVAAAVIAFWPRMTVTPSGLFDESNAYSETFTVTNTGFLAFEDVQVEIGICTIETAKHDFEVSPNNCQGGFVKIAIGGPPWWTSELRRDEPFSIVLSDGLNVPTEKYRAAHPNTIAGFQMMSELQAANVIVVVSFKPWPWPIATGRSFRFVAEEQSNGKIMWRAVPLSWKDIKLPD